MRARAILVLVALASTLGGMAGLGCVADTADPKEGYAPPSFVEPGAADGFAAGPRVVGTIVYGETIRGPADRDGGVGYEFEGADGDPITLVLRSDVDPIVVLYGPKVGASWQGAAAIGWNDDDPTEWTFDSRLEHVLPADGTYVAVVEEWAGRRSEATYHELTLEGPARAWSEEQIAAALELVQYASVQVLADEAGLGDVGAAAIAAVRLGPDGIANTADDGTLESLDSLSALDGVGAAGVERLVAFAWPRPGLFDLVPAGSSVAVALPVVYESECYYASYYQRIPSSCGRSDARSVSFELIVGEEPSGRIVEARGSLVGRAVVAPDGAFSIAASQSGCGERSCSRSSQRLSGRLSVYGGVRIASYDQLSNGGNQALGWRGTRTTLTQPSLFAFDPVTP